MKESKNSRGNFLGKLKSMWSKPPEGRFLSFKEMGLFGVYAMGVAFMTSSIGYVATILFIPYFYKIDALHGYIILAVASFINMCILPFIANKIEKTTSKWGRYKPYILFTLPLYAILAILVTWIPQMDNETHRILYAYMTCVPLLIANGFFYNMYQTMPTIITSHTQERADIMTPLGLIFGFAPTIMQIVAGPIRGHFMELGKEYEGIRIIGIISVILGILCVLCILKVKERVYYIESEEENKEQVKLSDAFKMLSKNTPLILLTLALVLGSLREFTGQFRMLIIQCRFAENVPLAIKISGLPMTIIGFAATVSMLLLPIVTRKMEKKNILILFSVLPALCNIVLACIGYENIPIGKTSSILITAIHFLMQITPIYLLVPIMLGEIADYQQYKTGKRLDGHIQNMLFTVPTVASQIFMIFAYLWQQKIGFQPMNYSEEAGVISAELQSIACSWYDIVAIISAISGILMAVVLLFYPLSKKKHTEAVEELKRKSVITNVNETVKN